MTSNYIYLISDIKPTIPANLKCVYSNHCHVHYLVQYVEQNMAKMFSKVIWMFCVCLFETQTIDEAILMSTDAHYLSESFVINE